MDFTVSGTTTTVDTTNLTVTDPIIKLAQGTTASPANDLGIIFTRGNGSSTNIANRGILWDESADEFAFANTNDEDGTTTGNVDLDDYANIHVGAITADDASTFTGVVTAGGFTIGSAAIVEAELEMIDGITAGTVAASKAVVVDANLDIASFRNLTATGAITADSLDIDDGGVDVNGTLEANAITIGGTNVVTGSLITTLGTISAGTWEATDVAVTHGGTGASSASAARTNLGLGTAAVAATGISNTNVPVFTSGVADNDFLRVDGTSIEGRSASEVVSDIGAASKGFSTAMAIAL